ncbi:MAG: restriction endonuclease [Planctomycetes bacterium]|nr:restriction endonuclease [Planctomycetota bacterium]
MTNSVPRHAFTNQIEQILEKHFGILAADVFTASPLLGYLNHKTRSASRGSKSRGAFANHYALYVLTEDYLANGFGPGGKRHGTYDKYGGARFSDLLNRQRELPFGSKLQNHALNGRLNDEFKKFYPSVEKEPIVRDVAKQGYWIQEDLLVVTVRNREGKRQDLNIAPCVIDIIDAYVAAKCEAFESFIDSCEEISALPETDEKSAIAFIEAQLKPEIDARVFEIVSFSILKAFYGDQRIYWGWTRDNLNEDALVLFKTGRTNANDGGIDFVMRPLGRFFQVTETIDVNKYFLDIDKIQRFPLTFVVKSTDGPAAIQSAIEDQAKSKYKIVAVVKSYMDAIEEIINIPLLVERLQSVIKAGKIRLAMDEIVVQSKVEFNYQDTAEVVDDIDETD